MKVLQLTTTPRSFFENQVTALERQGVDCTTLAIPGSHRPDSPRSVGDYLQYAPTVLGHSLDGYDVVHANYGLTLPFALAQPTRPVVCTLWGTDLMSDRRWLTALSRFGARRADGVVVPSDAMAAELSVNNAVVPFGIDAEMFRPIPRDEARERVGWDPDGTYVLFPYESTRPEKDYPRARRIVEGCTADAELKQVSGVDYEEMPYYMNASDALLVTSQRESGPMVVKEAAACNVPVVSTGVGFVERTLTDVDNSFVADSDATLTSSLDDVLASDARSNGRAVLDGLGLDAMGEQLLGVYERVLDERGERAALPSPRSVTR
ncbi:Glycosyl transferases group 1 [Halomicrobium zhouii]|uniref:Glycosyl transferases group 1 n=1 Tax=Halomicrobium zhouii TaxID=767519 RepID=A0A1I6KDE4_9EURY|nr:glycosyltransferase family 4 protein [Halomicrobium zhouii]SFR88890.1 Glycosyl transferases group 1 [Halomicrobium zhouii]